MPQVEIAPTRAPGKTGPAGSAPRTNYSRVNTGAPLTDDALAREQKAMAPRGLESLPGKVAAVSAHEEPMDDAVIQRPRLQDLVKSAMESSLRRIDIAREAERQAASMGEKVAHEACATCGKADCGGHTKSASADYALKLASAIEFIAHAFEKDATSGASITETKQEPGKGPGALQVSEARSGAPIPQHQGEGRHQPPAHASLQKGLKTEHSPTQLENTLDHPAGGRERMLQRNQGKTASVASLVRQKLAESAAEEKAEMKAIHGAQKDLDALEKHEKNEHAEKKASSLVDHFLARTKIAEDATNPAQISAGNAVPPETTAAGEAGAAAAAGAPQGPTNLVGSNDAARTYTRREAYGNRKTDLAKYWDEPALSSATDKTLEVAFAHTPQAGTKFSSAAHGLSTKTAAAKALLRKLAQAADAKATAATAVTEAP
jgi:hypothetical protein